MDHSNLSRTSSLFRSALYMFKASIALLFTVVASAQETVERDAVVQLVSPMDGETVYMPHPHFRWQKKTGVGIEERYQIQISRDEKFNAIEVNDSLDVVSRYVSSKHLRPGTYFWRMRRVGDTSWSRVFRFMRGESRVHQIKTGATQHDIAATLAEAAANTPAKVIFEKGEYRITDTIRLHGIKDLILDGNGSTLALETYFLDLRNCANITLQNMTVRPAREASTLVDINAVDPAAGTLTVQVKQGFPKDLPLYFNTAPRAQSMMRIVDTVNRGLSLAGFGVNESMQVKALGGQDFRLHGLPANVLKKARPGMIAYCKSYGHGFVKAHYVTRVTLSKATVLEMPGTLWLGREMDAFSCLSCQFLGLSPKHYTGHQGAIGNGRIGSWYEDCKMEMGADDNVMDHVHPWPIDNIDGNVATLKHGWMWPQEIREGDQFVLWDCMNGQKAQATRVTVLEVQDDGGKPMVTEALKFRAPRRLVLSKNAAALNRELKRPEDAPFLSPGKTGWNTLDSMLLFRLSPNNQDFVFRRNQVTGGSAGVFNNSTRALIADNVFKNTRGPAVRAGVSQNHDILPASGCGSRDYVIRDNVMENCGARAIAITSTAGIGGNIIIRNNTIRYTADIPDTLFWNAIIVIGNNDGVVVRDNLIQSPRPPSRGPWIRSSNNVHPIRHSNNRIDPPHANVPMLGE